MDDSITRIGELRVLAGDAGHILAAY